MYKKTLNTRFSALKPFNRKSSAILMAGALAYSLAGAPAIAQEKHAEFLRLSNCGAYSIAKINVLRNRKEFVNKPNKTTWTTVKTIDRDLKTGKKICINIMDMRDEDGKLEFADGDQVNISVQIAGGAYHRCGATTVHRPEGKVRDGHTVFRRNYKMRGTIHHNSKCRKRGISGYAYITQKRSCAQNGKISKAKC